MAVAQDKYPSPWQQQPQHAPHAQQHLSPQPDADAQGMLALLQLLTPDESLLDVVQRAQREKVHTGINVIDRALSLRPGLVLELAGPSGSGKTELLLQTCAHCLLYGRGGPLEAGPRATPGEQAGGGHVVFLDLDSKFDVLRLIAILVAQISRLPLDPSHHQPSLEADPRLRDALSRFHLITCHSSFDVLVALLQAQQLFMRPESLHRPKLLLIDNVAAFHYQDRAASYHTGGQGPAMMPFKTPPQGPAGAGHGGTPWQHQQHPQHLLQQQQQQQATYPQQAASPYGGPPQHAGAPPSPQSPYPAQPALPPPPLSLQRVHAAMAGLVRLVCREARCACVCSKYASAWSAPGDAGGGGRRLMAREVMLTPWQALITHRLLLLSSGKPHIRYGMPATHVQAQWQQGAEAGTGAGVQEPASLFIVEGDLSEA